MIVAYVLAYNEELNIGRCLSRLTFLDKVLVIDSGSTDRTREIALGYPNVTFLTRKFDCLANQHQFGLDEASKAGDWVLRLDSDWIVSSELEQFLRAFEPPAGSFGFEIPFVFHVFGQQVRASAYPPVVCLFRAEGARYVQDGHTERLVLQGPVRRLAAAMVHDDRKPIERYFDSQARYSREEFHKLEQGSGPVEQRVRTHPLSRIKYLIQRSPTLAVVASFVYFGLVRGALFSGPHARHYLLQRLLSETMIGLRKLDHALRARAGHAGADAPGSSAESGRGGSLPPR